MNTLQLKNYLMASICCLLSLTAYNQQKAYDIQLEATNISLQKSNTLCYEAKIKAAHGQAFYLSGQNYRLFYDASRLKFNYNKSRSLLPLDTYSALDLVQDMHDLDQSDSQGKLDYNSHLGFVNLATDFLKIEEPGVEIPSNGAWVATALICFDQLQLDEFGQAEGPEFIHWARKDLTSEYATAFVQIAEWISPKKQAAVLANEYFDGKDKRNIVIDLQKDNEIKAYPNPASKQLYISGLPEANYEMLLSNAQGQTVYRSGQKTGSKQIIELENLNSGVYQLQVITNYEKQRNFKIIKIQ